MDNLDFRSRQWPISLRKRREIEQSIEKTARRRRNGTPKRTELVDGDAPSSAQVEDLHDTIEDVAARRPNADPDASSCARIRSSSAIVQGRARSSRVKR